MVNALVMLPPLISRVEPELAPACSAQSRHPGGRPYERPRSLPNPGG